MRTPGELRQSILALGPWHFRIDVTPEVSTAVWLEREQQDLPPEFAGMSFITPEHMRDLFLEVYPDGLEGRSVLDCACNCGAYAFMAKEAGAGSVFGFDARDHWIRQAHFLQANRSQPTDRMRFAVATLEDLDRLQLQPFDLTVFSGIFYHLAHPVAGLKIAADLTRELLIFKSACRNFLPDGMLALAEEAPHHHLSGIDGLHWFPTGPEVVVRILRWLGFPETRVRRHVEEVEAQPRELGHLEILAARTPGTFLRYDSLNR